MELKTKRFFSKRKSCSCSMPGVWRAVAYCKGAMVIFHSPKACAHVARTMDISFHYNTLAQMNMDKSQPVPLLSSQLEEKHSIFGGVKRLSKCIDFAVKTYQPKCIVIANSCMSGVIGDDVESVGRDAEEKYNIPVIVTATAGFLDGEYYQGYIDTTKQLIKRFLKPQIKKQNTAILLGDSGGFWGHYATEVMRMLKVLGVKVIGQFPGYMPIDDLTKVTAAQASIILGNKNQTNFGLTGIAQLLKDKYAIDYIPETYPISWEKTKIWIRDMGRLFDCPDKAESLLTQETKLMKKALERFLSKTSGKKTVICIGRWAFYFDPAPVIATAKMLELDIQGVFLLPVYDEKEKKLMLDALHQCIKPEDDIPIFASGVDDSDIVANAELILTTHELQNRQLKQLFLPMVPKVGSTGEIDFMQNIYRTLCSRSKNGGLFFG